NPKPLNPMENNIHEKAVTTRGVGIKYGLYSAGFGVFFFLVLVLTGQNAFDNRWSWVNLLVSIVLLVLAHREFKQSGDGFMSYGQGVGIGFWMTLVSLIIGGFVVWLYANVIEPGVMDAFYEQRRIEFEDQGMPDNQIEMSLEWVRKLFWVFYAIFGLFFGVLLAVIVSIFTQKKNPQPVF